MKTTGDAQAQTLGRALPVSSSFLWWPSALGSPRLAATSPSVSFITWSSPLFKWTCKHIGLGTTPWLNPMLIIPKDFIFQRRVHSQVLGVETSSHLWGVTIRFTTCTTLCWADILCEWDSQWDMGVHLPILTNTSSWLMPAPCQGLEIKYLTGQK